MKARIFSTIILWALVASLLSAKGIVGGFFLLIIASTYTQLELYQLMEKSGWKPFKVSATILGILMLYGCLFLREGITDFSYILIFLALSIIIFSIPVILSDKPEQLKTVFLPTIFGMVYVPTMLSFPILFINKLSIFTETTLPLLLVLWIIVVVKFSDVGGLLFGHSFGKHKIVPHFSPKKTYEGLIGSIIFSILSGHIFASCCGNYWPSKFTKLSIGILSTLLAIVSLISDLIESGFKRLANEKDSGTSIPGIGGVFDLTDSLILTLPLGIIIIKEFILN
ncbi:MAG: phosphatidate cytidylyltransferase [Puniceicoccales bacterium]|jgi:phosphatidate cytidylyltransferase|nr:phosphatidate cytidylyltransferase [Puniceicoccales bacterium]